MKFEKYRTYRNRQIHVLIKSYASRIFSSTEGPTRFARGNKDNGLSPASSFFSEMNDLQCLFWSSGSDRIFMWLILDRFRSCGGECVVCMSCILHCIFRSYACNLVFASLQLMVIWLLAGNSRRLNASVSPDGAKPSPEGTETFAKSSILQVG